VSFPIGVPDALGRRVTMRLEGDQPRDRAITVAESIR
jgi:hypothetical protein